MSGDGAYYEVRRAGIIFRPIDVWPGEHTKARRSSDFRSSVESTMRLLLRELNELRARSVVLQLAIGESDFRQDGMPKLRANARHPGIILAFESKHGPLKFAVDTFWSWPENLRAIALGMEALRKVDRYGVTKRGEQYTGWRQLTTGSDDTGITNAEQARTYLAEKWGGDVRRALMETHPDRGGDEHEFRKVVRARELAGA